MNASPSTPPQPVRAAHAAASSVGGSITLVGMPGAGKSTVGRQLARRLGLRFVDSDAELEARLGTSIKAYFAQAGEAAFRDAEAQVIDELSQCPGIVLSTGGGAVLRPANRAVLHQRTWVVYLKTHPKALYQRLKHDTTRPLLQVADPLAALQDLFRVRDPLYREVAHHVLDNGRATLSTLVSQIAMQWEQKAWNARSKV